MYEDPRSDDGLVSPTYREAYPALKLVGVRNRYQEGWRDCVWHDRLGNVVGRAEIDFSEPHRLAWLHWAKPGDKHARGFEVHVFNEPTPKGVTGLIRPYAVCPGCQKKTAELYFVHADWKCSKCQGLVSRQTLLKTVHKKLLRARKLHAEVGGLHPADMLDAKFNAKTAELGMLRSYSAAVEITELPPELRPYVGIEWVDGEGGPIEVNITPLPYDPVGAKRPIPRVSPWFGPRSEPWPT